MGCGGSKGPGSGGEAATSDVKLVMGAAQTKPAPSVSEEVAAAAAAVESEEERAKRVAAEQAVVAEACA